MMLNRVNLTKVATLGKFMVLNRCNIMVLNRVNLTKVATLGKIRAGPVYGRPSSN